MKSVMTHDFSQVPGPNIQRSTFNRSHGYKTTFDSGLLIPILVDEALPGDTFNVNMTGFARLATPIVPVMDNMYMDTHFFSVPTRLVWDNWRKFMGEQVNPSDSTDFTIPQLTGPGGGYATGSIQDYFGLPLGRSNLNVSALPFRSYNLIFNEWFRDQNLIDSVSVPTTDGPDNYDGYELLRRGKRHDYFTSCLPFPQKGPAVSVPLGDSAPITGLGKTSQVWETTPADVYQTGGTSTVSYASSANIGPTTNANFTYKVEQDPNNTGFPNVRADLSNATAATINQLREAFQIQKMYERDARSGTRYAEIIKGHFGVNFQDVRYRPEYLGGGSSPINVTPVPQTSASSQVDTTVSPQGRLAAFGTTTFSGHGFTKSFTEHCIIIGLVSVRADLTYQQGLNRMWSRQSRFDFYFPSLAHLGEQAVLNQEIYCADDVNDRAAVFGYQERFAEYRYKPSSITGKFRSSDAQSLDIWHLSQNFSDTPKLDKTFISENPPIDRVIAVPSEPQFLFDSFFDMKCARPMPVYSVPGLIDHF